VRRGQDMPAVAAPRPRAVPPTAPARQPEPSIPERADASPEAEIAVERDRLQARFTAERADPAWASAARQDLTADFGRVDSNDVRIGSIECRASLCRADLVLANAAAGGAFLQTWLRQRAWSGPGFAATDQMRPDGARHLIVFLGRTGTDLARVD
ncbi:MAG TPA: hypothetical protein VIW26_13190, partial [Gemmatimonadales bacterium]